MTTPSMTACPSSAQGKPSAVASQLAGDVDLSCVRRARQGDATAFTELWNRYHTPLCGYFVKAIRNRDEAEDLASETLMAAFDSLPAFRGDPLSSPEPVCPSPASISSASIASLHHCTFRTYLYTIARNQVAQWIQKKRRRPCSDFSELEASSEEAGFAGEGNHSLEERIGASLDSDPLQALLREEQLDEVCRVLADVGKRSSEQFKALLFHYGCDLPHREIASLLDTRSATINTRLQEGRHAMLRRVDNAAISGSMPV